MKEFFKKVGHLIARAVRIQTKKQLLIILLITFIVDLLAVTYGVTFHYLYGDNMLMKTSDGLFVFNFFVWLFAYFFRGIKVRYIRRKTKNYVNPLSPEEVDSFHKVTYLCNYSVMLNAFINLTIFLIARFG